MDRGRNSQKGRIRAAIGNATGVVILFGTLILLGWVTP